ncbi:TULIP family P47-like protein [Streptomyces griseiscabiei]|uniref:TULIP family P47-like protein n=1 Tax=Streptomyces griseiscabiei TaxID=2993540 RepID=A0ABU4KZS5_9ACTN|nr:TULIP family P47-like protein [Streptomyces griseiscabiei]MBZ3900881.1 TULIP family P47-like protein [Streptomyces griseiscabiei]MDX2908990.1 TULIP family P47-like protein [Streptomyces griseiscabiei]
MDRSPLTRRGALTAAMATTAALAVPVAAHASAPAKAGAAEAGQLMPKIPKGKVLRVAMADTEKAAGRPGSARQASLTDDTVLPNDTMGWDTVSAVKLTDVNRAIAGNTTLPDSWSAEIEASPFSQQVQVTGGFDTWSLTPGGTGGNVLMSIPFTATLVVGDPTQKPTTYDIQGGTSTVEVSLEYHNSSSDRNVKELKLQSSPDDGGDDDGDDDDDKPLALVTKLNFTAPVIRDSAEKAAVIRNLETLLQQWLNSRDANDTANLGKFDHVFATVDLNTAEAQGELAWLTPTTREYAYVNGKTPDTSYLGVLCMTENRDPGTAAQELAPGAIIAGAQATFTLSMERVIDKMVMPALKHSFPDGDFVVQGDEVLSKGDFSLDPVKGGGLTYYPKATSFDFSVLGQTLQVEMDVHIPISPGIDGYATMKYRVLPSMTQNDKGEPTLTFDVVTQDSDHWYTVADWVEGIEIGVDIVFAILTAGVGVMLARGASLMVKVAIAVVSALVAGLPALFESIPLFNATAALKSLPGMTEMVNAVTGPITWADAKTFNPTTAMINGGLQVGGTCFSQ